jgi:hypothetical protein
MELLVDEAQVEPRFGLFGHCDSVVPFRDRVNDGAR